jgi:hypothetical protein
VGGMGLCAVHIAGSAGISRLGVVLAGAFG